MKFLDRRTDNPARHKDLLMPKQSLAACLAILLLSLSASVSAEPIKPTEQWSGFYPVKQLVKLPAKQQKSAIGAIQDKKTWEAVFKALQPDVKVPEVDFKKNIVVFARNIRFVNRIIGLTGMLEEDTLVVRYAATRTARPIVDQVFLVAAVFPRKGISKISNGQETVPLAKGAPAGDVIEVGFTVPHPLWKLQIQRVYVRPDKNIVVFCMVQQGEGFAAQVISTAKDSVTIKDLPDLPRVIVIHGKTWGWKNKEPYRLAKAGDPMQVFKVIEASGGKLLYERPAKSPK
jgi:hypothetical protein